MEQTLPQERKLSTAKHGALDQFELLDLGLDGSITVGQREPCHHRIFVLEKTGDKALQFGDCTLLGGCDPGIESFSLSLTYHRQKVLDQPIGGLSRRARLPNESEILLLLGGESCLLTNEQPDRLARRKSFGRLWGSQVRQRAALLSQCLQETPHQASCSFEAPGLDFFKELLTIMNTGLPSREHIGRIRVKDTAAARAAMERRPALFDPWTDAPSPHATHLANLRKKKTWTTNPNNLPKSILPLAAMGLIFAFHLLWRLLLPGLGVRQGTGG